MRSLDPVIWSKGTPLTPQYLQQQDRYIEATSRFQWNALTFRPSGFRTLRIDHEALAGGVLAISAASGLFADGLLFDIPESDGAPEPAALAGCFGPADSAVDFYLSIPHHRDRGPNIAARRGNGDARYRTSTEMLRDENTGAPEKPLQLARKNLRLIPAHESRDGLSTLRIARVVRTPAGSYELDYGFVPPLLDITASDYLTSIARRLVEILVARSSALTAARRRNKRSLADFTAADIPNFWLLYNINTWLPVFRHIFESRKGHPEGLFAAMTSMAGSLTTFSKELRTDGLPSYEHDDLGGCFADLDEKLRFLLETAVPRNFVSLRLKEVRPSIHAASIDSERYLASTAIYLAIRSSAGRTDVIEKVPGLVKLCSLDHVDLLVRQALPGIELTHVPLPPGAIPVKLDFEYFALEQNGPAWEAVVRSRNIAAYIPAELPGPEVELVLRLPETHP